MSRLLFILFFLLPEMIGRKGLPGGRQEAIIDCGPTGVGSILPDADGRYAPVFTGWGHYHYPISTSSDSAQFYFDQGLSLYYSYHLPESAASFREAAQKDTHCAMAYWGQALAMGPYYNSTYFYKMPPEILPVLDEMNALAPGADAREKDLISALKARYSGDTTDSRRAQLNRAYSEAMKGLISRYPDDNDIRALYIDAMMSEHAWDMWDNAGNPKPWTPELVKYCEEILARNPDHPAALHYHIHLLEASQHPEATLASADRLKDLMPGVPHMVHMASHTYQRTGLYAKGVAINDSANAAQRNYSLLAPQLRLGVSVIHYDAVEAFCAMNGAMYEKAMQAAEACNSRKASWPGLVSTNLQFLSSMPLFVLVRLGKWQEILARPLPDNRWVYAGLISDFARGMAFVHTGKLASAQLCLDSLHWRLQDPSLKTRHLPFNAPINPGAVAERLFEGQILFQRGRTDAAIKAFQMAMEGEDGLAYLEPNEWPLPVRQFAGVCLMRLGKPGEAEKLYREDLVRNPGNGWSLLGLYQSLEAQHKKGAAENMDKARAAFAAAEEIPPASAY